MIAFSHMLTYVDRLVQYIENGTNGTQYETLTKCSDQKKVVVFDLDMTIGDFTFISSIYNLCRNDGIDALDAFNRCFRPGMFHVLELLSMFKRDGVIYKVVVYTNNTGGKNWVGRIVKYIHKKLNIELFDDIISAFEVNYGEESEIRRNSMDKDIRELKKILNLSSNDRVMFIDDMLHTNMIDPTVYYIHIQPYIMYYTKRDLEYIFQYQYKISDETRRLLFSKYDEYGFDHVDMKTECMKMIEFTKLIEHFTIQCKTGYINL